MSRLPFGYVTQRFTVPFREEGGDLYVVYFSPTRAEPTSAELIDAAWRWQQSHLEDPLKLSVSEFFKRGLMQMTVRTADSLPDLPIGLLSHSGMDGRQEEVIRSARQAVLVVSTDLNRFPRTGLFASLASALGVAEELDGVIFDPGALRVIDAAEAGQWLDKNAIISASEHIILPFSIADSGLGWMTVRGLQKFGLPELQLKDVPPHLQRLGLLLEAVAQFLIEESIKPPKQEDRIRSELVLDRDVTIDRLTIARALRGNPDDDLARDVDIEVGLRLERGEDGIPFITVERPQHVLLSHGEWLYAVMNRLLPIDDLPFNTETGNADMNAAHKRAVDELPVIRAHFQGGLEPGEILMVKHGFITPDEDTEFMWVTVITWGDGKITGQLSNIPNDVPSLQLGQLVEITEHGVYDWVLMLGQDRKAGGYTEEVARRDGRRS